jgi:hypothetical protein
MSSYHALIALLDGSVLERSLRMSMAVLCVWRQQYGWLQVKSVVLLRALVIFKYLMHKKLPLAGCLLMKELFLHITWTIARSLSSASISGRLFDIVPRRPRSTAANHVDLCHHFLSPDSLLRSHPVRKIQVGSE